MLDKHSIPQPYFPHLLSDQSDTESLCTCAVSQKWQTWLCLTAHSGSFLCYLFIYGGTGVWPQGLMLAREALYHLSHSTARLLFVWRPTQQPGTHAGQHSTWGEHRLGSGYLRLLHPMEVTSWHTIFPRMGVIITIPYASVSLMSYFKCTGSNTSALNFLLLRLSFKLFVICYRCLCWRKGKFFSDSLYKLKTKRE
jgi:hypothetical protein